MDKVIGLLILNQKTEMTITKEGEVKVLLDGSSLPMGITVQELRWVLKNEKEITEGPITLALSNGSVEIRTSFFSTNITFSFPRREVESMVKEYWY